MQANQPTPQQSGGIAAPHSVTRTATAHDLQHLAATMAVQQTSQQQCNENLSAEFTNPIRRSQKKREDTAHVIRNQILPMLAANACNVQENFEKTRADLKDNENKTREALEIIANRTQEALENIANRNQETLEDFANKTREDLEANREYASRFENYLKLLASENEEDEKKLQEFLKAMSCRSTQGQYK